MNNNPSSAMIVREGWLLKRGEHIKNWRTRYFVLFDDGSLLGFKQKPPPGQYRNPTNNFTVKGCHIFKVESATHFIFLIKGLSPEQEIERNFSAGNDHDRDIWCNAIMETATRLPQNNPAQQNNAQGLLTYPNQIYNNSPSSTAASNASNGWSVHNDPLSLHNNQQLQSYQAANNIIAPFDFGLGRGQLEYVQQPKKMSLGDFYFIKLIGRGSWGKVMLSKEKSTDLLYAIKILKKHVIISQNEVGHTLTESRVLRTTNHPFLISLKYSFRDGERLCFVMEYAGGGELFYHLSQERKFSEDKTKFYGAEIVSALGYLHDHEIIYRDLKLENLLLGRDGHIKIADFGLCKDSIKLTETTRTFCGTPEYLSPEVIEDNNYGRAVDWWSLGVLLYEMMCGNLPFNNRTTDVLFREILLKPVSFPATLSEPAKLFLHGLLIKDPLKRLGGGPDDAREIMIHAFFRGLDWQALIEKRIEPPWLPEMTSETDTRYFDRQFTTEPVNLTPIDRPINPLGEVDASFFTQFSFAAGSQLSHR